MIVAFYSQTTGRLIQASILEAHEKAREVAAGEARLDIPSEVFKKWMAQWQGGGDRDPLQEFVSAQTGLVPTDDRYVFIQDDHIVDWIGNADPAMGHFDEKFAKWPDAEVTPHPEADERWTVVKIVSRGGEGGWEFTAPAPTPEEQAAMDAKAIVRAGVKVGN